jgi:gluconokinase
MIVLLMGPSGAGKTTIGEALAAALGWEFLDADALHPPANVAKMARGEPLDDGDRGPWLAAVAQQIAERLARGVEAVVACSALKAAYRRQLLVGPEVRLVSLTAPRAVLAARLAARRGHFMPPSLLDSQLATLERPDEALEVDAVPPVPEVVAAIRRGLGR